MVPFLITEYEHVDAIVIGVGETCKNVVEKVVQKSVHDFESLVIDTLQEMTANEMKDKLSNKGIIFFLTSINNDAPIEEFYAITQKLKEQKFVITINISDDTPRKGKSFFKFSVSKHEKYCEQVGNIIDGVLGALLSYGDNDINIHIDDLKVILQKHGKAFIGISESLEIESELQTMRNAIGSSNLDETELNGMTGVLVHFKTHPSFH